MRQTDRVMPSASSDAFQASKFLYTLSIIVPSRSNRKGVLTRSIISLRDTPHTIRTNGPIRTRPIHEPLEAKISGFSGSLAGSQAMNTYAPSLAKRGVAIHCDERIA